MQQHLQKASIENRDFGYRNEKKEIKIQNDSPEIRHFFLLPQTFVFYQILRHVSRSEFGVDKKSRFGYLDGYCLTSINAEASCSIALSLLIFLFFFKQSQA